MLESLFKPKSVAILGASRSSGKVGREILHNLLTSGFGGRIIPVNPFATRIEGLRCYPKLTEYHGEVDLSLIALPADLVPAAVYASVGAGAKTVAVISAGFRETGPEGAKKEKEITDFCKNQNIRLLGPNCLGVINTEHQMNASFSGILPPQGPISLISQSGALCTAVLDWAVSEQIGLAKVVSMGNKADLNESDLLTALAEDKQTKVIMVYVESILSGTNFIRAAELAASLKPVVILKAGTTEAGKMAAHSHTGSLAGEDVTFGAAFRRSGMIRAENFQELLDFAKAFAMQPLPKGHRVAVITNAGGLGALAADAVENNGLKMAPLTHRVRSALREKLPQAAQIENPIDVLGDADPERYALTLLTAQEEEAVQALLVLLTPQAMTRPVETAEAIANTVVGEKPILTAFMGGKTLLRARKKLRLASLPDYPSPERAVRSLRALREYALWRQRPPRVLTRFPVHRRRVERILGKYQRLGIFQVPEMDAKTVIQAYGFNIPQGWLAGNFAEALEAAERIGYPLALKIVSPEILHKSEVDGVKLNLTTPAALRDAYDLLMLRTRERRPDARIQGVLVEKMAPTGIEVILGMRRDPVFGPVLMFGLGGIFVETLKDVSFYLAPITKEEGQRMLEGTRSYELLRGTRGRKGANLEAIADGLQRISQLATDFPQIQEMDINPFIVGPTHFPSLAVDARLTLREVKPSS